MAGVRAGMIETADGRRIDSQRFGEFSHGFAVTSHASQSKTVDHVVVVAERLTAKAAYVACSRGRVSCVVHTPDKAALLDRLPNGNREAALDFVGADHALAGTALDRTLAWAKALGGRARMIPRRSARSLNGFGALGTSISKPNGRKRPSRAGTIISAVRRMFAPTTAHLWACERKANVAPAQNRTRREKPSASGGNFQFMADVIGDLSGIEKTKWPTLWCGMRRSFVQARSVRIDGSLPAGNTPHWRKPTISVSWVPRRDEGVSMLLAARQLTRLIWSRACKAIINSLPSRNERFDLSQPQTTIPFPLLRQSKN